MSRQLWDVVGGGDKGGILVRRGQAIGSAAHAERLSTGAVVSELERTEGGRLHYSLESGTGPPEGWVSLKAGEKELLVPHGPPPEPPTPAGGGLPAPPSADFAAVQHGDPPDHVRVWAVSDIHTDKKENKAWVSGIDERKYLDDVLILAGDVSNSWEELEATLRDLKSRFARVFFCAGNHDLWVRKKDGEDSVAKLRRILQLCKDLGVEVLPSEVRAASGRLLVVPLQAWHHPQWDTEPDLDEWKAPRPLHQSVSDYWLTSWPGSVSIQDGSAAKLVDAINDEVFDMEELLKFRSEQDAVLSFSHFVPRLEANPEKRYLIPPCLAKAVGSNYLRARMERLRPDVHVFGHTHFGYDLEVEGVRYVQAALATPGERQFGGSLVALDGFPVLAPQPVLVWDSREGWAPKRRSAWSDYYTRYGRRPEVTNVVPSVVADASGLAPAAKNCQGGFLAGRAPIWMFGPLEHRLMEAQKDLETLHHRLATEAAAEPKAKGAKDGDSRDEPRVVRSIAAKKLLSQGRCVFVDVREDAEAPRGGCRIAGSVALPHPAKTHALAGLPDEELLVLCERINALGGGLVVYGEDSAAEDVRVAALLLAAFFRYWPNEVQILHGGIQAWIKTRGEVEQVG
mmetsp:Transcript_46147/g.137940  ORF Transcript_46147/g.137940 Transcript_46147/m.137940 type:complete len:625 (-) Transcript_46147:61-1935(-)